MFTLIGQTLKLLILTSLLSVAGSQAVTFAALPEPVNASTDKLNADLSASRVYIKVTSSTRLGHDHGVVGKLVSGSVQLGADGELVFDMRSFITDTLEARRYVGLTSPIKPADQQKSTANMLGPNVLDVAKYPTATFKIKSCVPADGQAVGGSGYYMINGDFVLHGTSRNLNFKALVEPATNGHATHVRGAFAILQTSYGIQPYTALGGLVGIEDKLEIWGDFMMLPAKDKPQAATGN